MNDLEKELLHELELREAIPSRAVMLATMGNEHAQSLKDDTSEAHRRLDVIVGRLAYAAATVSPQPIWVVLRTRATVVGYAPPAEVHVQLDVPTSGYLEAGTAVYLGWSLVVQCRHRRA